MAQNEDTTVNMAPQQKREMIKLPEKKALDPLQEMIEDDRKGILHNVNEPLREQMEKIQTWFDHKARVNIIASWELGKMVEEIEHDVVMHRGRKYGAGAMDQLTKYFNLHRNFIYDTLKLAKQFTKEEIDELCERRMPNGQLISFSHLMTVISLPREERRRLLDRAVEESWTSGELNRVVVKGMEPARSRKDDKRGRPIGKPKTFDAVLAQMQAFADEFMNRAVIVWNAEEHSPAAKATELGMENYTEERITALKALSDQLQKVAVMAKKLADDVLFIHDEFQNRKKGAKPGLKKVNHAESEQEVSKNEDESIAAQEDSKE